ncbi:DUF2061 domain-containing protein [Aurantiacibacter spongiae]|uniref:DUF2061 domain-containing protein n=1 Tax=Aurantiacibacter spongiae TaxID=2488860 RepID=A0A3N5D792_9SPHN|nr:DUF2061 domain-containing protein [Aurantiacibacter spongiae]RPF70388.1 DUF2061 domain-containing protein [Aurantiacibacter spongiae]
MREKPETPIFGPEAKVLDPTHPPQVKQWRRIVKAVSWRAVGTVDTFVLSFLLITYLGPLFGREPQGNQAHVAGLIAITEVATKLVLYFLHEWIWDRFRWGVASKKGRRRETIRRSSVKTVTWRAIASADTVMLAWLYTGNIETALSIGGLEIFTKMTLYFVHERIWARLPFGIERHGTGSST